MNNLDAILEIAIGLVLTWLIISVATVEVQDMITKMFNRRAKFLEQSILDMFRGEQSFVDHFYAHPVIQSLYKKNVFGKRIKPDYIPNEAFAEVALETFIQLGTEDDRLEDAAISIEQITNNKELSYFVSRLLPDVSIEAAAVKARDIHEKAVTFKNNAETWFDKSMEKASYWYKDRAKTFALLIGIVLAATFNVDSIQITEQLWREPTVRQTLVAQAQVASEDAGLQSVSELEERYEELNLPVGWGNENGLPNDWQSWLSKVVGVLITGLAAMQGAPFWFDMLRKLLNFKGGSSSSSSGSGSGSSGTMPPSAPQPPTEPEPVG